MSEPRTAGAIYDLGYQRYEGARLGRSNAVRTLLAFSLRSAFGIGRGARAKAIPFGLMTMIFIPALIQIAINAAASGAQMRGPFGQISYPGQLSQSLFFLLFFAAAQAPELVVADRQQGVLSLYLSRPIGGTDYALAKLGAFFLALLLLTLGPQLLLIGGKVAVSTTPWPTLTEEAKHLLPILATTLLASLYIAVVALTLASLASRRAYGTAAVMAFFLLLPAASRIAWQATEGDVRRHAVLGNPVIVLNGLANWVIGAPPPFVPPVGRVRRRPPVEQLEPLAGELYLYVILATIAIGLVVFLRHYRKAEV